LVLLLLTQQAAVAVPVAVKTLAAMVVQES
jgi:hypothetical protein